MAFVVVTRSAGIRSAIEGEIRRLYCDRYVARLGLLPNTLVAEVSPAGIIECAAGIRFGFEGLFSECYLDLPIEHTLSRKFECAAHRDRIVEVCNLVATRSGRSLAFIRRVIDFVKMAEAEWAIFTATRTLRALLQRSGLNMIELARAERSRVDNPDDWGSYYKHDPRVMAVSNGVVFGHGHLRSAPARHGLVADA